MASTAEGDERVHASYDVGRLLAFSDGVFAIAITLLVLGIPVPNVPPGPDQAARLAATLSATAGNLEGFALSFVLVGAQWIGHHRILRGVTFSTARLLWLNLLLLLGICLVPFATSLLVRYGDTTTGAIAYASLQAFIGVLFIALRAYLAANGAGPGTSPLLGAIPLGGFVLSIPVAFLDVRFSYALWLAGFAVARILEARARPHRT
jgi:uncharacterized membrane protein